MTRARPATRTLPRRHACATSTAPKVRETLREQFKYANPMHDPAPDQDRHQHGRSASAVENKNAHRAARRTSRTICRPEADDPQARVAVAGFKSARGLPGRRCRDAARRTRMWEFVDRLVTLAIPRIRDFRGLPTKFDGNAATTPWASPSRASSPRSQLDKVEFVQGMDITFVTTANDRRGRLRAAAEVSACPSQVPQERIAWPRCASQGFSSSRRRFAP